MAGMSDYYKNLAGAFDVLDDALPSTGAVSQQVLTEAFAVIRQTVGIAERGAVHDEVLDRLAHGELSDSSLAETVVTMARELPLAEPELA